MNISIIIPTLNRARQLNNALFSIVPQLKGKKDVELIIVDNGSTDDTKKICSKYDTPSINFRYYYDDIPGLLTGRHRGAKEAKGDVLCYLDDDVILNPHWVENIKIAFHKYRDISFMTGSTLPFYESYPPDWLKYFWVNAEPSAITMCTELSLADRGTQIKPINIHHVWGLNFCVRKKAFEKLEGFHPDCIPKKLQHFQGDGETGLTFKAEKANYKALYHPGLTLYHQIGKERLTEDYFKQRYFYIGVCMSFMEIRKRYLNTEDNESQANIKKKLSRKILDKLYIIKNNYLFFKNKKVIKEPKEITNLKAQLNEEYLKGYQFHQNVFDTDEIVKNWVLKENYLDYKLPK